MFQPSNFHVDVTASGKEEFEKVFSIFFEKASGHRKEDTVKFYSMTPKFGMALYQADYQHSKTHDKDFGDKLPLPYPMNYEAAKEFVWNWIKNCSDEYWGEPDDIDGSVSKNAWRIYTIYAYFGPTVIIKPEWAEYHK